MDSLQFNNSQKININDRPTFYYNDDITKPIRAGGVIIYREINNKIQFLLIKKSLNIIERYEDIGGKTDIIDVTQYDPIAREVSEETNLVIGSEKGDSRRFLMMVLFSFCTKLMETYVRIQNEK
jgi:hypothetical protein